MPRFGCLLVLVTLLPGCFSSVVTNRAALLPPLPKDCTVTWEHGGPDRLLELVAKEKFVQVAFISATPAVREFTPKLKKHLRPKVCKRGGNYVLMTGSFGEGARGTSSFEVLNSEGDKAKAAQPGPVTD